MPLGKIQTQIVSRLLEMGRLTEEQRDALIHHPDDLNGDALGDTSSGFWGPVYELMVKPLIEAVTVRAPYPPSTAIRHAEFGKDIRRSAIDSDNWPLTWGDDTSQYTSYGDGFSDQLPNAV